MESRDLDKYLGEMYNILYRFGMYGVQALSIIGSVLKLYYEYHDIYEVRQVFKNTLNKYHYIQDDWFERLCNIASSIADYPPREMAIAYKRLLDNKISKTDAKPTEDFYVILMQAFIKAGSNSRKVVDLCVGTGQLLRGLTDYSIAGFDRDTDYVDIARSFLYLYNERHFDPECINFYNGLIYKSEYNGVFYVMDPPIGNRVPIPDGREYAFLEKHLSFYNSQIQSEYLFLSKVVFSEGNSYYACLMPKNFLYAQDRLKKIFRSELFKNSIDVVVFPPQNSKGINKIILYGHNFRNYNNSSKIYFVSPKNSIISEQEAIQVAKWCIGEQVQDSYIRTEDFTITTRARDELTLLDNIPQYTDVIQKVSNNDKSANEIIEGIQEANKRYLDTMDKFNSVLMQISEKLKHKYQSQDSISIPKISQPWFKMTKSVIANAINKFVIKSSDWTEFTYEDIHLETLQKDIEDLNTLYKANRLKIENNKLYIYSKRQRPDYVNNQSFSDAIYKFNLSDKNIQKKLDLLSEEQKDIYMTLIQFCYEKIYQDDKEDIWHNFSKASIFSTINTLKILNLVYEVDEIEDSIAKYIPYTSLIKVQLEGDVEGA